MSCRCLGPAPSAPPHHAAPPAWTSLLPARCCPLTGLGWPPTGAGLERSLEARRKERQLCRLREQAGLADAIQPELTYAVELGLAAAHQANQLYDEALDLYGAIVRAKLVPQARCGG
jgi:hypothetical protein